MQYYCIPGICLYAVGTAAPCSAMGVLRTRSPRPRDDRLFGLHEPKKWYCFVAEEIWLRVRTGKRENCHMKIRFIARKFEGKTRFGRIFLNKIVTNTSAVSSTD